MLLFSVRYSSAARIHEDSQRGAGRLMAKDGQLKEGLPECSEIAKDTYPGGCNPETSAFACYSLTKLYKPDHEDEPVEVHWACSVGLDQKDISKESCLGRPWNFDGEVNGKGLKFTAESIYAGACAFSTLPERQEVATKAGTTPESPSALATTNPEQSAKDATTQVQSTKAAATPEQSTEAATTPMQPSMGPATTKNGAAGNSAGSLLSMSFILAVCYLH